MQRGAGPRVLARCAPAIALPYYARCTAEEISPRARLCLVRWFAWPAALVQSAMPNASITRRNRALNTVSGEQHPGRGPTNQAFLQRDGPGTFCSPPTRFVQTILLGRWDIGRTALQPLSPPDASRLRLRGTCMAIRKSPRTQAVCKEAFGRPAVGL